MVRDPLLRTQVGKKTCSTWKAPDGTKLKLCVEGLKFGFSANLMSKSGKKVLPVPTGDARTMSEAIQNAKRFLDGVATKRN